jgi:hypothetical protein
MQSFSINEPEGGAARRRAFMIDCDSSTDKEVND